MKVLQGFYVLFYHYFFSCGIIMLRLRGGLFPLPYRRVCVCVYTHTHIYIVYIHTTVRVMVRQLCDFLSCRWAGWQHVTSSTREPLELCEKTHKHRYTKTKSLSSSYVAALPWIYWPATFLSGLLCKIWKHSYSWTRTDVSMTAGSILHVEGWNELEPPGFMSWVICSFFMAASLIHEDICLCSFHFMSPHQLQATPAADRWDGMKNFTQTRSLMFHFH